LIRVYREVLRTPGVPRLVTAFLAAGTAITMTPVALVLFARDATQSFATASLVLAAQVVGNLGLSPARGRLVDRIGARQAVLRLAAPSAGTDLLFIVAGHAKAGAGVLVALAFVAGAITPPTGAAVRGMWSQILGPERAHTGFALMTVTQEATFFVGPLVAGGLVGLWSPTVAVAVTAGLSLTGALIFASAPASRARGPQPRSERRLAALAAPGARTVLATAPAFGLAIGILDVTLPAYARAHGSTAASGVLLSAFAAGVGLGGFLYGTRPWGLSAGAQFPRLCLLATLGLAPPIVVSSLALMVPAVFVAGLCFAPITVCFLAVIDDVSEPEHRTETFTWMGSLNGAGLAVGAVIAGQLLSASTTHAAIAASCAATLLTFVIATTRAPTLTPART
jgi:MFS family permease